MTSRSHPNLCTTVLRRPLQDLQQRKPLHRRRDFRESCLSTQWASDGRDRQLVEGALPGRLVGPPPDQLRAVPEPVRGDVVVLDLDDERRPERLPVRGLLRRPAARPARSLAGKPGGSIKSSRSFVSAPRSSAAIADVKPTWSKFAAPVIQAEKQRTHKALAFEIAEAADDAVRRAQPLHLDHGALARLVKTIQPLRDHAVDAPPLA